MFRGSPSVAVLDGATEEHACFSDQPLGARPPGLAARLRVDELGTDTSRFLSSSAANRGLAAPSNQKDHLRVAECLTARSRSPK